MRRKAPWIAFLVMCFTVLALTGLFASYATSIPLELALRRSAAFDAARDAALAGDLAPLAALKPLLEPEAVRALDGPGTPVERLAAAKAAMLDDQERASRSAGYRIRLMLGVVFCLATALGAGILTLASRPAAP